MKGICQMYVSQSALTGPDRFLDIPLIYPHMESIQMYIAIFQLVFLDEIYCLFCCCKDIDLISVDDLNIQLYIFAFSVL